MATAKKATKSKAVKATSAKVAAAPSEPRPVGRPTKWKDEFIDLAFKFCLMGATDAQLGGFFEVDERTINDWKLTKPEFSQSIFNGREKADADISEALYHRAKGYKHKDTDIRVVGGSIVQTEVIKEYPPDTAAASLWLRNRQSHKWRDKVEVDHSGSVGFDKAPVEELTGALNDLLAKLK
jgi:hypothetical protein